MPDIYKILGTARPDGPAPELCKCGHTEPQHFVKYDWDDIKSEACQISDCDCISFWPPSHDYPNVNSDQEKRKFRKPDKDELFIESPDFEQKEY